MIFLLMYFIINQNNFHQCSLNNFYQGIFHISLFLFNFLQLITILIIYNFFSNLFLSIFFFFFFTISCLSIPRFNHLRYKRLMKKIKIIITIIIIIINLCHDRAIGQMGRVFANGRGDRGSFPGRVIPKTQRMVLNASLFDTQHYKVKIKGKVEQFRDGLVPFPTPRCSSY